MSQSDRLTAAVVGASGYAGGELLRILAGHPMITPIRWAAGSKAGVPVTDVHPGLTDRYEQVFAPTDPAELAAADLVFLALPHGQSAAIASQLPTTTAIVDLGADHRLVNPLDWQGYYGDVPHAQPWTYGLPELPGAREAIAASRRVAVPGCYATAITLSLWPLIAARLIDEKHLVVTAASGTSGAGRAASESLLATEVMGSMKAYKAGGVHQHTPEIEQALRAAGGSQPTLSFTPLLAPMPRGILASSSAPTAPDVTSDDLRAAFTKAYADEQFVRLLPGEVWPVTAATAGANTALIQTAVDEHASRAIVVTAIDNLQKGAAGQAVQCANLMFGLPEESGLSVWGVAP
jgi:N-acetyl-gamma-glutamyl-phosphate reductase